jgi:hypothetical protein
MAVEVHLYGHMRQYAPTEGHKCMVRVAPRPGDTIRDILERMKIPSHETYHVFLNGALAASRNSMAPWLGYQQSDRAERGRGLETPVDDGDRLGIFGQDMPLLVV